MPMDVPHRKAVAWYLLQCQLLMTLATVHVLSNQLMIAVLSVVYLDRKRKIAALYDNDSEYFESENGGRTGSKVRTLSGCTHFIFSKAASSLLNLLMYH